MGTSLDCGKRQIWRRGAPVDFQAREFAAKIKGPEADRRNKQAGGSRAAAWRHRGGTTGCGKGSAAAVSRRPPRAAARRLVVSALVFGRRRGWLPPWRCGLRIGRRAAGPCRSPGPPGSSAPARRRESRHGVTPPDRGSSARTVRRAAWICGLVGQLRLTESGRARCARPNSSVAVEAVPPRRWLRGSFRPRRPSIFADAGPAVSSGRGTEQIDPALARVGAPCLGLTETLAPPDRDVLQARSSPKLEARDEPAGLRGLPMTACHGPRR